MNLDPKVIGYIILGLVIFFLLTSFLIGLHRGLKKTLFRLAWLLVGGVIIWFITPPISAWLNTFDLSSMGLDIYGPVNKLSDIGVNILNSLNLDSTIINNPALKSFAENLPTMILNVLLFVVIFFVAKWILWPIWALISSRIFDKEKRAQKQYKKKLKELKKQGLPLDEDTPIVSTATHKNAFLGGIFGIIMGGFVCAVALSPVIGLNAIYQNVNKNLVTTNAEGEEVPYLSTVIDDKTMTYLNSYQDSIASKVTKYSGIEWLSDFAFSNMARFKVKDKDIYLTNEVNTGINAYNTGLRIMNFTQNINSATQDSFTDFFADIKKVLQDLKKSDLFYTLGNDLLDPLAEQYFLNNNNIHIMLGGVDYADLLKDAYRDATSHAPMTIDSLQTQIDSLVDIGVLLNKVELITPFIKGEAITIDSVLDLISNNIPNVETFSQDLTSSLFKISILKTQYVSLVDNLVQSLYTKFGIGDFSSNKLNISEQDLEETLSFVLSNGLNVAKIYNTYKGFDFKAETQKVLSSVGKILDKVKVEILSSESYNTLMTFIQTKVNEITSSFADLSKAVAKISQVASWENELNALTPLYQTIVSAKNLTVDSIMNGTNEDLPQIGAAIDRAIGSSVIITNENLRYILESVLSQLPPEINEYLNIVVTPQDGVTVEKDITLKDVMLNNIFDKDGSSEIVSWEKELTYSFAVIGKINNVLVNFNKEELSKPENQDFKNLGMAIDNAIANTHLFASNKVLRSVLDHFITQRRAGATFPAELEKILNYAYTDGTVGPTVYDGILANIYNDKSENNTNITSWAEELEILKVLLSSSFDGSDLSVIGETLDNLTGSHIFSRKIVNSVIVCYIDAETETLPEGLKTGPIVTMKNNIQSDNGEVAKIKYKDEFKNLQDLLNIINKNDFPSQTGKPLEQIRFEAIGRQFNLILGGLPDPTQNPSNLLTQDVINEMLSYYLLDFSKTLDKDLKTIITNRIANNKEKLNSITNYELEFSVLYSLVNVFKETELRKIGKKLDEVRTSSNIIDTNLISDIIGYYIDNKVSKDDKYLALINEIKQNASKEVSSYEIEFAYMNELSLKLSSGNIVLTGEEGIGVFFNKLTGKVASSPKSDLFNKVVIAEIIRVAYNEQISSHIDTIPTEILEPLNLIGGNIDKVKNDTLNKYVIKDYAKELNDLDLLIKTLNSPIDELVLEGEFGIGAKFNIITGYDKSQGMIIVDKEDIIVGRNVITSILQVIFKVKVKDSTAIADDIKNALNPIENNFQNIINYETELTYFGNIVTNLAPSGNVDILRNQLTAAKENNSKLFTAEVVDKLIEIYTKK